MDSRRDFTSKKVFSGYFSELGEKANSGLPEATTSMPRLLAQHHTPPAKRMNIPVDGSSQ